MYCSEHGFAIVVCNELNADGWSEHIEKRVRKKMNKFKALIFYFKRGNLLINH